MTSSSIYSVFLSVGNPTCSGQTSMKQLKLNLFILNIKDKKAYLKETVYKTNKPSLKETVFKTLKLLSKNRPLRHLNLMKRTTSSRNINLFPRNYL